VNLANKSSTSSLVDTERYFEVALTLILSAMNMKIHDTNLDRRQVILPIDRYVFDEKFEATIPTEA
jgi:hypothetical protein